MKITHFCFENFKGYSTRTKIPLAPITAIYGQNSSGKSSIIQAMLFLSQAFLKEFTQNSFTEPFEDYLDFENIVYEHDTSRTIKLGIRAEFEYKNYEDLIGTLSSDPFEIYINFDKFTISSQNSHRCLPFEVFYDEEETPLIKGTFFGDHSGSYRFSPSVDFVDKDSKYLETIASFMWTKWKELLDKNDLDSPNNIIRGLMRETKKDLGLFETPGFDPLNVTEEHFLKTVRYFWPVTTKEIFGSYDEYEGVVDEHLLDNEQSEQQVTEHASEDSGFLWTINKFCFGESFSPYSELTPDTIVHNLLDELRYFSREQMRVIGPFRRVLDRTPSRQRSSEDYVGLDGSDAFAILESNPVLAKSVQSALEDLDIPYDIAITPGDQNKRFFFVSLEQSRTKLSTTFKDVGVGISQVVPIIVQLSIGKNTAVVLQQPELHLHPRLQGNLAEYIAKRVLDQSKAVERVIIETHSESMALRWRKLVRKGKISKDMITFLYVERVGNRSTITEIKLDEEGDFTKLWPEGFFEDRLEELL